MSGAGIRWDVLTIGHMSRNPFWGEEESEARRVPLCTSALVRSGESVVLVDPPLPPEEMAGLLDRRTGLTIGDVTHVYLTHFHGGHRAGLEAFPDAEWMMPDDECVFWNGCLADDASERSLLERLLPVPAENSEIAPGVLTMHLPGHTPGLAGLVFTDRDGFRVVLASDAVMTREFFEVGRGHFSSHDLEAAGKSIDRLRREADIILPGYDNYFFNRRGELS